jgi:hypothetical protein
MNKNAMPVYFSARNLTENTQRYYTYSEICFLRMTAKATCKCCSRTSGYDMNLQSQFHLFFLIEGINFKIVLFFFLKVLPTVCCDIDKEGDHMLKEHPLVCNK